jgi:hypothetical protein
MIADDGTLPGTSWAEQRVFGVITACARLTPAASRWVIRRSGCRDRHRAARRRHDNPQQDLAHVCPPQRRHVTPNRVYFANPHHAGLRPSGPGGSLITSRPSPARSRGSTWRAIYYRMKSQPRVLPTECGIDSGTRCSTRACPAIMDCSRRRSWPSRVINSRHHVSHRPTTRNGAVMRQEVDR